MSGARSTYWKTDQVALPAKLTAHSGCKRFDRDTVLAPLSVQLSQDEIQDQLHRLLGRFFVIFAGVELNLSLRVGGAGTFQEKLERLVSSAGTRCGDNDDEYCQLLAWYMAADSIRGIRNRLAHGRWGYLPLEQCFVHVSGYPPDPQDERHISLSELGAIVEDAALLKTELNKITQ